MADLKTVGQHEILL